MRRAAIAAVALSACLPVDDRPEPGSVEVSVQRSDAVIDGFTTDDGWHITYERFVTSLGDVELEEDTCNDYSFTRYDRLFDFADADTPAEQKLNRVHGLGSCNIEFSLRAPRDNALLGHGVTEADREMMRIEDTDPFAAGERTTVLMRGRADKDGVTKTFAWFFRRGFDISNCRDASNENFVNTIQMESGVETTLAVEIRPQELFRMTPSRDAPIEFGRIAAADDDGDGEVTFEELAEVTIDLEAVIADLQDELPDEVLERLTPEAFADASLGRMIYDLMVPRMAAAVGSEECEIKARFWLSH